MPEISALRQGARRENILHGSLTDEQRCRSDKDRQPFGLKLWRAPGGVAPQSQNASAMLFRRAFPAAYQSLAHPFPIYEMRSKERHAQPPLHLAQAPSHSSSPSRAFIERIRFTPRETWQLYGNIVGQALRLPTMSQASDALALQTRSCEQIAFSR